LVTPRSPTAYATLRVEGLRHTTARLSELYISNVCCDQSNLGLITASFGTFDRGALSDHPIARRTSSRLAISLRILGA
jgi:hypothetical protein